MPSLGQTVAALSRERPASRGRSAPSSGVMREVTDFAPNPGALRMRLYTPEGLEPRSPLVVVLHGCTQAGEPFAEASGWLTLADRHGFAVLCPEQTRANNSNLCFNWYEPGDAARGGGEAASIAAMVVRAIADGDLDARRVFVTGLSAGGAMAAVMLATYPELFAGGAVIGGLPYGSATSLPEAFAAMSQGGPASATVAGDAVRAATSHSGPWPPISIWHGQDDAIVRPAAGDALARQWTDVHGLAGEPVTARTPAGRDFLVWLSAAGDPVVELHRIPGMGHGVPLQTKGADGSGTPGPYMLDVGISSSLEIALGWGIADRRVNLRRAASPAAARDQTRSNAARRGGPTPSRPRPNTAHGVTEVIENALRAAGLMK